MKLPPGLSKSRRARLIAALVVVLLVVAGVGAWFAFRPAESAQAADTTVTVSKQTLTSTVSVSGTLAAASSADLDFTSAGTVTKVLVDVGDTVTRGQALARIDATSLKAALTAATSALAAAETQYDELVDDDADDVQIAAAESAVVTADDSLDEAQEAVDNAVLRSTLAGTVTTVNLQVGDVVTGSSSGASSSGTSSAMGGTTTTSTSAVRVVASGKFVVDTTVSASDVEKVAKGQQATLTVTGVDESVFGTVSEVGKVAQTGSGGAAVFPVTLKVTGTRDDLYPGTSATAEITVESRENVLAVNTRALSTTDGKTTVTVRKDGQDSSVEVTTGDTFGQGTEITQGLSEGDVIVMPAFSMGGGGGGRGGSGGGEGMPDLGDLSGFTPPDGASGGFPGGGPMGGN